MRIVLDTNVVVSAAINPKGPPAEIVKAWMTHSFVWVASLPLLNELERTLLSPRIRRYMYWDEGETAEFLRTVRQTVEVISPDHRIDVITADPADNRLPEATVAAGADYIVSGDQHLLGLRSYEGIPIVTPARFVAVLAAMSP
jgi:hypothetical protein